MSLVMSEESMFRNISDEQKNNIAVDVVEKLLTNWHEQFNHLSDLRGEKEKIETEAEQEILHLKEQLQEESLAKNQMHVELQKAETKIKTLEDDLRETIDRADALVRELEHSETNQKDTNTRNVTLSGVVDSKSNLINELQDQLKSLENNLQSTQKAKYEALIQAEDANTFQIKLQFKEKHHKEEKNLMTIHSELLHSQLEERVDEVRNLRQEHSTALLTIQSELNHSKDEGGLLTEERDALQKTLEEKSLKIQNLLESLNKATESETKMEGRFSQELAAQERLVSIYNASNKDQRKRCEELEKGIEELRHLLQDGNEQYGALEKAKIKAEEEAHLASEENILLTKELRDELQKVKMLLEEQTPKDEHMDVSSPDAFVASRVLSKGASLSQLYNKYIIVSDKLMEAEEEKKRLQRYMNQILLEIEVQAPILIQQKNDYLELIETNNSLNDERSRLLKEHDKLRELAEAAQRRSRFLGRESQRLSQQVKDLGKQVTILLTQVEAARAGLPPPPTSVTENLSNSSSANDALISEHLVAFRNVAELQDQNQKLLVSIRDMEEKLDTAEQAAVDEETKELNIELEAAKSEMKELSENRDRMRVMMDELRSQNDVYRILAEEKTSSITRSSPASAATPDTLLPKSAEAQLRKELEKGVEMHEEYRKERDKNAQIEKDEFERMKITFNKAKKDNLKLLCQAESNEERIGILQSHTDSFQRQLKALEERNASWQDIVSRHESTIETFRQELLQLTKKVSHEEKLNVNLREEKALLKESEARLRAERDSLQHAQTSQNLININLQAIKNNLDRRDSELDMRHANRVTDLTEQCSKLKAKIESNVELKDTKMKLFNAEQQLQTVRKEAEDAKKEFQASQRQLSALKEQFQELQNKSKSPSPSLKRPPLLPSPTRPLFSATGIGIGAVRDLQVQLSEERTKVSSVNVSLEQSKNNLANLKEHLNQQEVKLQESNSINEKCKETIESLHKELTEHEKTISELKESERTLKQSTDVQLMRLTEDLEERENEMEEIQKKLEDSSKVEAKAQSVMANCSRMVAEAQEKYEREVVLHGADLQALTALKEKLSSHNAQLENAIASKLKAQEELSEIKAHHEQREEAHARSIQELIHREAELESQIKSLLDRCTLPSDKMANADAKLSSSTDDTNLSFNEDSSTSSSSSSGQLREVIKYLRRERELAVGKAEVAHAESLRLETQKKSLESQVELLNRCVAEERLKNQDSAKSACGFNELKRKVQTIDALADSNRLLREQKEILKKSYEENVSKVASLQTQIEPMQETIRDTTVKLEDLKAERKLFYDEKELYKKKTQELTEKLNKARPEDMAKLVQELTVTRKQVEEKQVEFIRTKNMYAKLQKMQQTTILEKQKLEQNLEESRKTIEDLKKLQQENNRLKVQLMQNTERMKNLETSLSQSQNSQQQEVQKLQEQNNLLLKQVVEYRQKEEDNRRELEKLKKEVEISETKLKEINSLYRSSQDGTEHFEKQILQLRKIATKYKKKAEMRSGTTESPAQNEEVLAANAAKEDDRAPPGTSTANEDDAIESSDAVKAEVAKKDTERRTEDADKLQSELQQKMQNMNAHYLQKLGESQRKQAAYESRINSLEKEKEKFMKQNEELSKKCLIQQRMINIEKHTSATSKGPGSVMTIEKVSDTPPTANIKPMAAAPVSPVAARSQGSVQSSPGPSRSIPTASIRPMAPSPAGQSTSIVVPPMEALSAEDGDVSSTVTLPQAAVPTSTATPSISFALSATASPMPVSGTIASTGEPSQQPPHSSICRPSAHSSTSNVVSVASAVTSQVVCMPVPLQSEQDLAVSATGTVDSIISQAIALVAPHGDLMEDDLLPELLDTNSSDPPTRKRKLEEEDSDEESKRYCVEVQESSREEELEEDAGEPSSSSQRHSVHDDDDDDEILIVPSDDEEDIPSSQSKSVTMVAQSGETMEEADDDNSQGLVIVSVQGGREAEMYLNSEAQQSYTSEVDHSQGAGSSDQTSLSFQLPTRPCRGSLILSQEQPTSSRQSLTPLQQLSQLEESADDRLVPSTPTLGVPRDGLNSPHVPSQDFIFTDGSEAVTLSHVGPAQITEGGIIDVTRMDLAQLDDGTQKSTPTTPARRSPAAEFSSEGNISSSVGEGSTAEVEVCREAGPSSERSASKQQEPDSGLSEVEGREKADDVQQSSQSRGGPSGCQLKDVRDNDSDNVEILLGPREPVTDAMIPLRTTRSAAVNQPQSSRTTQIRRPTPITFENPRPLIGEPAFSRGRGVQQARRGRPVARRSRAHRGHY